MVSIFPICACIIEQGQQIGDPRVQGKGRGCAPRRAKTICILDHAETRAGWAHQQIESDVLAMATRRSASETRSRRPESPLRCLVSPKPNGDGVPNVIMFLCGIAIPERDGNCRGSR